MKIYKAVFAWFGGVLTETISERAREELVSRVKGRQAVDLMIALRSPAEMLSLGKITAGDFCQQAVDLSSASLTPANLAERMAANASARPALVDLIGQIPQEYQRWLVVDYPVDWFRELAGRLEIEKIFPSGQTLFTSDLKLQRMDPDIFYQLPRAAGLPMEDCLVIDPITRRATSAMRHGLAAIIYVYPERLKHELALQGIWQTDADVMHPTSSERVKM